MNFFIEHQAEVAAPSKEFFEELLAAVRTAVLAPIASQSAVHALCEYLDCLDAKLPGLPRTYKDCASQALREYLGSALKEDQASWARKSPAARALLLEQQPKPKRKVKAYKEPRAHARKTIGSWVRASLGTVNLLATALN